MFRSLPLLALAAVAAAADPPREPRLIEADLAKARQQVADLERELAVARGQAKVERINPETIRVGMVGVFGDERREHKLEVTEVNTLSNLVVFRPVGGGSLEVSTDTLPRDVTRNLARGAILKNPPVWVVFFAAGDRYFIRPATDAEIKAGKMLPKK